MPALATMHRILLAATLGVSCAPARPAACPEVACPDCKKDASSGAVTQNFDPAAIRADQQCVILPGAVVIKAAFLTRFTYKTNVGGKDPTRPEELLMYWNASCSPDTDCHGFTLDLTGLAKGERVGAVGEPMVAGQVVASTPTTATIRWGIGRTLTVDTSAGTVSYVESSPYAEARGVGKCSTQGSQ